MTVEMSGNIEIERRAYGSPEVKRIMEDAYERGLRAALEVVRDEDRERGLHNSLYARAIERLLEAKGDDDGQ